jgi:hypothetical protein
VVQTAAFDAEEDRPDRPLTDVKIQSSTGTVRDRDRDVLASLAHDCQRPVSTFGRQVIDVSVWRSRVRANATFTS